MPSWAITGATRGIGFGFVDYLSSDTKNEVFAIIRSRETARPLEELKTKRENIHIVVTDISDPHSLEQAVLEVAEVTNGSLDVLILNAGSTTAETSSLSPTSFHGKEKALEEEIFTNIKANMISNIYVVNSFLQLIRSGKEKKIVFVSSGAGSIEFTRVSNLATLLGYSASKAGMNIAITKFGIELNQEGIKTLSLSPGWVNTDAARGDPETRNFLLQAFRRLDPSIKGPIDTHESVTAQLQVIRGLTEADSGKFLTHHGNEDKWF